MRDKAPDKYKAAIVHTLIVVIDLSLTTSLVAFTSRGSPLQRLFLTGLAGLLLFGLLARSVTEVGSPMMWCLLHLEPRAIVLRYGFLATFWRRSALRTWLLPWLLVLFLLLRLFGTTATVSTTHL